MGYNVITNHFSHVLPLFRPLPTLASQIRNGIPSPSLGVFWLGDRLLLNQWVESIFT